MNRSDIIDRPYSVTTVTELHDRAITMADGWTIGCDLDDIHVGDLVELWGDGIGYPVRGLAVGARIAWYRTHPEQERYLQQQRADRDLRQRDQFEAKRADLDAAYAALPEPFQRRIDRFRSDGGPDWRWKFEPYEMMVCVDAVRIAEWCANQHITIGEFVALPYDEQKAAGIDEGHSGNSFGCAVDLARLWPNPDAVVAAHGALVPLVGCDEYGCRHEVT